jgi:uncharacterized protein YjbI with pentapeptide repeats
VAGTSITDISYGYFEMAELSETSFHGSTLREVVFRGAYMIGADLSQSDVTEANLHRVNLRGANLSRANLRNANLSRADLVGADLTAADLCGTNLILSGAVLEDADLTLAVFSDAQLSGEISINTKLCDTDISGCNLHGISAWNVDLRGTIQTNLVISAEGQPKVTVDNLAMAQFMCALLNNDTLRHMIDTVATKLVLILGRFTAKRKHILDAIRQDVRARNLLPVVFDFEKPSGRDLTETIATLAHLAKYVVADLTGRQEHSSRA